MVIIVGRPASGWAGDHRVLGIRPVSERTPIEDAVRPEKVIMSRALKKISADHEGPIREDGERFWIRDGPGECSRTKERHLRGKLVDGRASEVENPDCAIWPGRKDCRCRNLGRPDNRLNRPGPRIETEKTMTSQVHHEDAPIFRDHPATDTNDITSTVHARERMSRNHIDSNGLGREPRHPDCPEATTQK